MIRGTREWAVAEINCCRGCPYDCRYCYARAAALKSGVIRTAAEWSRWAVVDEEVNRVHPRYPGQVMFPTAHDIVVDNLEACIKVIGGLVEAGNRVLVVSKPRVACIDRLCREFEGCRQQLLFRFTITARSSNLLSFWEPGAPTYEERRAALALAFARGFTTSVSIEPMLDSGDVLAMIGEIGPWVSHSIWLGRMNRIAERVCLDSDQVCREVERIEREQNDAAIMRIYTALRNHPLVRWKESIKQVVGLPMSQRAGLDR